MNLGLINRTFKIVISATALLLVVSSCPVTAAQSISEQAVSRASQFSEFVVNGTGRVTELANAHTSKFSQLAAPGGDSTHQPEIDTPVFNELKATFESGQIFAATFSHTHLDSFTGEETLIEGRIWIAQERYRVEGDEQVMVVDGETSRAYNGIENRVIINDYDEETDDFAPSRMLRGVDESYTISERTQGGETVVTLVNDDPFALFTHVEIYISQAGIPVRIVATDQVENVDTTTFSSGRFIPNDNTLFQIDLPEDAERVDLRD